MDFLSKQIARVGKQNNNLEITFRPLKLKVNVTKPAEYYVVFKRGPQKFESQKYLLEKTLIELKLHNDLVFASTEVFQKTSGFYKEKDGSWQEKKAQIEIRCVGGTQEKICEHNLNLSSYIGRGLVKETISLTGSAYYIDIEIAVEESANSGQRATITTAVGSEQRVPTQPDSDQEEASPDSKTIQASASIASSASIVSNSSGNSQTQTSIFAPKANSLVQAAVDITPKINEAQSKLQKEQAKKDQLLDLIAQFEKELAEQQQQSNELKEQQTQLKARNEDQQVREEKMRNRCGELEKELDKIKQDNASLYGFN